jgi:hypothetical protein
MYALLVRLILLAALMDLGISLTRFEKCSSRECLADVERASRKVLEIDWKPISVFREAGLRPLNSTNGKRFEMNKHR